MDEPCESQQQVVWMLQVESEMQKVAVAADISVLFFSAGASFLWQNMQLCYLNRFLQLWVECWKLFEMFPKRASCVLDEEGGSQEAKCQ